MRANRRRKKSAEFVAVRSIPSWQHNSIWSSVNFGNFNKYSSCAREQQSRKIHFPNLAETKEKHQERSGSTLCVVTIKWVFQ